MLLPNIKKLNTPFTVSTSNPSICRAIFKHLRLHPRRCDVWLTKNHWVWRGLLDKEMLLHWNVSNDDFDIWDCLLVRGSRTACWFSISLNFPLHVGFTTVASISSYEFKQKRKLRIWEVSIGLLVKERGEMKVDCIDTWRWLQNRLNWYLRMITNKKTIPLPYLITIVFFYSLLFPLLQCIFLPFWWVYSPPFYTWGRWVHEC